MVSFEQAINQSMCKIVDVLMSIRDKTTVPESHKTVYDSWTVIGVGKSWFLERLVTFAGTTITVNLDLLLAIKALQKKTVLPDAFQLNRITQIFNDATSKSFSVRLYDNPACSDFVELDTQTGNTATSRLMQGGTEYKYPAEFRVQLYYSDFVIGKTVRIRVQVDEL